MLHETIQRQHAVAASNAEALRNLAEAVSFVNPKAASQMYKIAENIMLSAEAISSAYSLDMEDQLRANERQMGNWLEALVGNGQRRLGIIEG